MKKVAFALFLFLLDFASKFYVHHFIPLMGLTTPFYPYGGVGVFQNWQGIDFSINHVLNSGVAWGMLSSLRDYLPYVRIAIIVGIVVYLFFFAPKAQKMPLVMIITGALCNVADHFLYGQVVDMFYFKFWGYSFPVFNVADSAIFCGISWLMLQSFFKKRHVPASE